MILPMASTAMPEGKKGRVLSSARENGSRKRV
jgi:hypothetical protein